MGKVTKEDQSIVCFCYRKTTKDIKEAYQRLGSLHAVQQETNIGLACRGCNMLLQRITGEAPEGDPYLSSDLSPHQGAACMRPGRFVMKGFIIANGTLESTVSASNALAPQLEYCDATTQFEYCLYNHDGKLVLQGAQEVKTNHTFHFDTREYDLPRPFFGMFSLRMRRENIGASRFNIHWSNGKSIAWTHENADSSRVKHYLPFLLSQQFLEGSTDLLFGIMNPHFANTGCALELYDPITNKAVSWHTELPPFGSKLINLNEHFLPQALQQLETNQVGVRVRTLRDNSEYALSLFFFMHNRKTDIWSANHV